MSAVHLAAALQACGLRVKLWREKRVYLYGYGRDINAYVEPVAGAVKLADGAQIVVLSNWKSPQVAQRCKSVKHAILLDLYTAGLLTERPPEDWKAVKLEERPRVMAKLMSSVEEPTFEWPSDFASNKRS